MRGSALVDPRALRVKVNVYTQLVIICTNKNRKLCIYYFFNEILLFQIRLSRLIEPSTNTIRTEFKLEDISYWATHKENERFVNIILL